MTYLLWQIFACLLGTAILFLALGWLLRGWLRRGQKETLVTESERASWQTSLEGLRAKVEAETTRRLAAEKALEDAQGQAAKISSLLDQHTVEIRNLSKENTELKAQVADLTPKLAAALSAGAEVAALRSRVADLEPKLQAAALENSNLKDQMSDLEAQAVKLNEESGKLRGQIADLAPKLAAAVAPPPPPEPAAPKVERDDLKKIYGIGPVLERRLNDLGVFFFRDIALWTKEDILRYEAHLKEFPDRIERDNWVAGAREEHFKKYGEQLVEVKSAQA